MTGDNSLINNNKETHAAIILHQQSRDGGMKPATVEGGHWRYQNQVRGQFFVSDLLAKMLLYIRFSPGTWRVFVVRSHDIETVNEVY